MMSSPSELSLECKPHQSYSMLLKSFGEKIDQTQNLEEFVARLEEERVKIDAFKRELPLCMQLLTNAMEASRQQLQSYRENQGRKPVLEEFIPLKNNNAIGEENEKTIANTTDHNKANWMTSAQLWSPGSEEIKEKSTQISSKEITDIGISKLAFDNNFPSPTLALASTKQSIEIVEDNKNLETVNNYSGKDNLILEQGKGGSNINQQPDSQSTGAVTNSTSTQQHRKARRCWSPDLHRRFVNALQMLGGSQVATPKQIRELMKVDGLTNDEVKSHLQKYRLHTRRPSPSPQVATSAPHLVVLGGIWVPPEYAAAAAHGGAPPAATLYGAHPTSHAPSPHYIAAPHGSMAQEFYSTTAPQPLQSLHHLQHHHQHQQLYHHGGQIYKPPSNSHTHSSPEPESRGTGHGDRSESIEDGKSECSS
ncbi:myb family transcription factor EFM [Nicotiana tabacum]|uniref:Myb family transcription factor EFM n=2 Tax=Nicotiana TaxID=4085 RepID=A0AC58RU44_TOBAC|nr:PREDICTED: uncharacterized protein LOC104217775 [Nicotiana sylvestris]